MSGADSGGLPSWLVESFSDWQDPTRKPWRGDVCETCGADDDVTLCGECSDDMGDFFDVWPDAVADLAPADRIPCGRCGS